MAKKKTTKVEAVVAEAIATKKIEAVKSNKVGLSTQDQMNKVQSQVIDLVYSLEARIVALEAKKD